MRFLKLAEEQVFTLQRAAYGPAHGLPDRPRQPDQQRVWQRHDIGWRLAPQPACQLPDFLALKTLLAAQHGNSQLTQKAWVYCRSEEHTSELQSRENLVCR